MVQPNPTNPHHVKIAELAGWEEPYYDNLWNNFGLDSSTKVFLYTIFTWCILLPIFFFSLFTFFDDAYEDDLGWLLFSSFALIMILGVLSGREYLSIFEKFYHKGLKIRAKETARHNEEKEGEIEEEKKSQIKWVEETIAKGGLENYEDAIGIFGIDPDYAWYDNYYGGDINSKKLILGVKAKIARELERLLRYEEAIEVWEELKNHDEAARIRKLKAEQGSVKVTQKIVHGDEVTKTEIKDSVLNRSNIGGSSSKMQELEKLAEMKDKGIIDDDEFKQMKKEILGK
jgi:hypothetical protein